MGYYVTHLLQCNPNSRRCIWRWRTEPLRAAADWHAAIEDAPLENNKSGLLNLARLSGADARRPWWMVSGESVWLRQRNLTGPSCEEPTPSRRCFIKPLLCFKGHVESSGWRSVGQAIHSLTLTTGAFLIGGRRREQPRPHWHFRSSGWAFLWWWPLWILLAKETWRVWV